MADYYIERERELNERPDPIKRNLLQTMGCALIFTGTLKACDMYIGVTNIHGISRGGAAYINRCRWGNYAASVRFDLLTATNPMIATNATNSFCYLDTSLCNPSRNLAEKTTHEYTIDKVYSLYLVRETNKCVSEQERIGWMVVSVLFLVIGIAMIYFAYINTLPILLENNGLQN